MREGRVAERRIFVKETKKEGLYCSWKSLDIVYENEGRRDGLPFLREIQVVTEIEGQIEGTHAEKMC